MTLGITPLPTPPSRADPTNFAACGDALMSALPQFVDEANALAAAMGLVGPDVTDIVPIFAGVQVGNGDPSTTARFLAQGNIAVHGIYGFADTEIVQYTSSGSWGQASFNASRTLQGAYNSDHLHAFQALDNIAMSGGGTLANWRGLYAHGFVSGGTVTNRYGVDVEDVVPTGSGAITNQYGVYIADLNGATNNWAIYVVADTQSYFGGAVLFGANAYSKKNGSDLQGQGAYLGLTNLAADRWWQIQLSAGGFVDYWNYDGSTWGRGLRMDRNGFNLAAGADSRILLTTPGVNNLILGYNDSGSTNGLSVPDDYCYMGSAQGQALALLNTIRMPSLAGTGTRHVVVDANGVLSAP